jgi:O-antigen/teichoic acid export membrane protein
MISRHRLESAAAHVFGGAFRFRHLGAGWMRSAMRGGAGRSMLAVLDQAVVSAASFGTVILLGRLGSPEQLGVYYLALTVLQVMFNIQGELITAPFTVFSQRRKDAELAEYTGSILVHQALITAVSVALLAGFAVAASLGFGSSALVTPLLVMLIAGPCWLVRGFVRYLSFAKLRFVTALLVDAVAAVLQMAALVFLHFALGRLNAASTYAAIGLSCLFVVGGWWYWARPEIAFARRRFWPDWRENWSFSRWALTSQLVCCLPSYVLPWVLAERHGEGATGVFAACASLCGVAMMFVLGMAHALTPQAARAFADGGVPALRSILSRTGLALAAAVGAFCLVVVLAGDVALFLVYGTRYFTAHDAFALLALGVFANTLSITAGNGLWAVNRPKANLVADACTMTVTVTAAFLLVSRWSVSGAAAAILLGNIAGAAARLLTLRYVLREVAAQPVHIPPSAEHPPITDDPLALSHTT